MEKIEWHDVQGLVLSGYPQLPYAAYIPWYFLPPAEQAAAQAAPEAQAQAAPETQPQAAPQAQQAQADAPAPAGANVRAEAVAAPATPQPEARPQVEAQAPEVQAEVPAEAQAQAPADAEARAEAAALSRAEAEAQAQAQAKAWLASLTARVMRADAEEDDEDEDDQAPAQPRRPIDLQTVKKGEHERLSAINVAFTASGLTKLGVPDEELSRFSNEFCEGMAPQPTLANPTPRRTSLLGDVGENSPCAWDWGGWNDEPKIDGVLLLYAPCPNSLQTLIQEELSEMRDVAAPLRDSAGADRIFYGRIWSDRKEHFGFKDGISQPVIEGTNEVGRLSAKEARISVVKPGEILHGYLNERGGRVSYASAPQRDQRRWNRNAGPPRDLARNGTYLVFRQLEQNVELFRSEVAKMAYRLRGNKDQKTQDWIAARMIGRTQEGEPLIPPSADSALTNKSRNDFLYYFEDRFGLRCPLGAHIRRANPRDIVGPDPDSALRLSKMHRIIRRGRAYGEKLPRPDNGKMGNSKTVKGKAAKAKVAKGKAADGADSKRGMLFIALNADIAGQFELIQHTWINNGRFNGLYEEMDPLVHFPGEKRVMTIQRRPTSLAVDGLKQFVRVRGGAYFFLPGLRSLRSLAQ